jgi:transposase
VWHASGPAAHKRRRGTAGRGGTGDGQYDAPTAAVGPTDEWEQLALLCLWPEQRAYEEIRPLTLFGSSVAERAGVTGTPERTLYRRLGRFEEEGVEALFGTEHDRRKRLPPSMRRLIVDLKADHPGLDPNEIANACHVRFGRRPDRKTVAKVLSEEPVPLRIVRRFPPYHEVPEGREQRLAVVWRCTPARGFARAGAPR